MRQSRSVQLDNRSVWNFIARLCCTLARQTLREKIAGVTSVLHILF